MPVDKFGRMSDAKSRDTGVSFTYINNNYVRSHGSTPGSCSINMRGNTFYNVYDPENHQDVATKKYADNRPHIIAVQASYSWIDLIKGEYQFTFSGNTTPNLDKGFLIPQSGRIKKIKVRIIDRKRGKYKIFKLESDDKKPIFLKIIAFENPSEEEINLLAYSCDTLFVVGFSDDSSHSAADFCQFDPDPRNENITISEGDILNILSEINFRNRNPLTYLFTFLIELDPL